MSDHFINLNCANCGAKLDVYDDMERFACGYCGNELIAQRRGGTVALKAVTEAIGKIQIGTDKTAAELAIARYEKEFYELSEETARVASTESGADVLVWLSGLAMLLVGLYLLNGQYWFGGLLLCLFGVMVVFNAYRNLRDESPRLKDLRGRVRQLQDLINEKRQIADGTTE